MRTSTWATIVYPESAPNDWMQLLDDAHVPAFISPLHDRDRDNSGNVKKPHYHVIIFYESLKSQRQAQELFETINGVGTEPVKAPRAYTRYLCHLDNPEKAQYDVNEVIALAGANYPLMMESPTSKYVLNQEMMDYCSKTGIVSYAELCMYARRSRFDWFRLLIDDGFFIERFLKSFNWTIMNNRKI